MGGHARQLLESFPDSRVIGIDMDNESLAQAKNHLAEFGERIEFHHLDFKEFFERADIAGKAISGILVDPGISMVQLKDPQRGFSHSIDAPLDMRKDRNSPISAAEVVNSYTEKMLTDIFEKYGEVPKARFLAKRIIETRLFQPFRSTLQLTAIIEKLYGWKPKRGKTHPAANVFQALRIVVNKEVEGIDDFIRKIPHYLKKGARIVFLTFHSVEDRIVKNTFIALQKESILRIIKPFPTFPSESEVAENLPSRSVKLRAGEIL